MDVAKALTQARRLQEKIMTDVVLIQRQSGVIRDELGTATPAWEQVYQGKGLVQALQAQPQQADSAGKPLVLTVYACKIPWDVVLPKGHHRVTVTASLDPANLGEYTVLSDSSQGLATARRLICERVR